MKIERCSSSLQARNACFQTLRAAVRRVVMNTLAPAFAQIGHARGPVYLRILAMKHTVTGRIAPQVEALLPQLLI